MRRGVAERVAPARRRPRRRCIRRAALPEAPVRAGSAWWRRRKGCLVLHEVPSPPWLGLWLGLGLALARARARVRVRVGVRVTSGQLSICSSTAAHTWQRAAEGGGGRRAEGGGRREEGGGWWADVGGGFAAGLRGGGVGCG